MLDTAAIRARLNAASEGPWAAVIDPNDDGFPETAVGIITATTAHEDEPVFVVHDQETLRADAQFIAHARQDVAALVDENARLRQVIAHLMTNPLEQREAVYYTSDIDGQTGRVDITDGPDDRTTIRITEQ